MRPDTPDPDGVHKRLQDLIGGGQAHSLVNVLPQVLETIIDHELWRVRTRADGTPFASLGEYLTTWFPFGAGCEQTRTSISYSQLMELCQGFPRVVDVLAKNAPKGKPGRKKVGEEMATVRLPLDRKRGACATPVLQAKLAEHHPGIWADFIAGKFGSVRAAAEAAGIVKNANDPLSRLKSNWKKATPAQRAEFLAFIEAE